MKHTGKIGHLSSIFMMENGLPAHAGMWDGPTFPMCLKSLIYNHKNTENEVCYTAGNLENREIRINTHKSRALKYNKSIKLQWIRKIYIDKGSPFSPDKLSKSYHTSALPVKVGEEFPCPRCNAAYGKFPSACSRDFLYHPNPCGAGEARYGLYIPLRHR